ncbi:hypothetical protein IVA86_27385 [Bradyrhizobium sp. 146]|uniref:hypothetical protein n=1 Tax=Bradyrhizobium sp. 146 TaxID=2782622 RepID=UPI001FF7FCE0|nr:hypothetical protein [Bradyrhizobium sp. 146]MCK1705029.1 hypothetical protein [Bradyrhizobium sp. 146]
MSVSPLAFYVLLFALALAPSIFFSRWLSAQDWERKDKIAAWDPFIKVMAIAGAVIIGLASFERFLDQHRQELAKEMLDRAELRNGTYNKAIKAGAAIAIAPDLGGSDIASAVTTFWQLYWGELAQFEGAQVEGAMVQFGRELQVWQRTGQKPERMDTLSLQLAKACRAEMETYQKQIDSLKNQYARFLGSS